LSNAESLQGLQQAKAGLEQESKRLEERQTSLEERVKILEEKLAIQVLEEKNRMHYDAIRELESKIANLEQQLKPSPRAESAPNQMGSEPTQEISDVADEEVSVGVLQQPEQSEVEVSQEGSKKKRRGCF
jgi:CII-binding regulator of phage lambda lysogenization HflD